MRRLKWQGRGENRSDARVPSARWSNRWPSVIIRRAPYPDAKWRASFHWPLAWRGPDTPRIPEIERAFATREEARDAVEMVFAKMVPAIEQWNEDLRAAEKAREEARRDDRRREQEVREKEAQFCLLLQERLNIVAETHREPGWVVVDVRSLTNYLQRVGVLTD